MLKSVNSESVQSQEIEEAGKKESQEAEKTPEVFEASLVEYEKGIKGTEQKFAQLNESAKSNIRAINSEEKLIPEEEAQLDGIQQMAGRERGEALAALGELKSQENLDQNKDVEIAKTQEINLGDEVHYDGVTHRVLDTKVINEMGELSEGKIKIIQVGGHYSGDSKIVDGKLLTKLDEETKEKLKDAKKQGNKAFNSTIQRAYPGISHPDLYK